MNNIAHLYTLPIATWQAAAELSTSSIEGINQSWLENVLHLEYIEAQTAQIVGVAFALYDLDGAIDPETGSDVYTPRSVKKFAADLCERATIAQLGSLSHTAKRAGAMLAEIFAALEKEADMELTDREDYGQHYMSDETYAQHFQNHA